MVAVVSPGSTVVNWLRFKLSLCAKDVNCSVLPVLPEDLEAIKQLLDGADAENCWLACTYLEDEDASAMISVRQFTQRTWLSLRHID